MPSGKAPKTSAPAGNILMKGEPDEEMSEKDQKVYRSGVGNFLHLVKWSRPECLNRDRDLSRFLGEGTYGHMGAMLHTMKYCVSKSKCGLTLRPSTKCNGDRNIEFVIRGKYDSVYTRCPDTRNCVSGYITFLCDAVVTVKSVM